MNCLKCGRETEAEQVFCEDCLQQMEKYPVKPDTAVKLPERRPASSFRRPAKRRTPSSEEQVKVLKKRVLHLTISLIFSLLIIAVLIYPSIAYLVETHYAPGQNYSTFTATTSPAETEADVIGTP